MKTTGAAKRVGAATGAAPIAESRSEQRRVGQRTTNCLMRDSFKLECLERLSRLTRVRLRLRRVRKNESERQIYSFCRGAEQTLKPSFCDSSTWPPPPPGELSPGSSSTRVSPHRAPSAAGRRPRQVSAPRTDVGAPTCRRRICQRRLFVLVPLSRRAASRCALLCRGIRS